MRAVGRATLRRCDPELRKPTVLPDARDELRELEQALAEREDLNGDLRKLTADLDLSTIGVRVTINGAEVATGRGDAVLGHPLHSIAWLAAKLAAYGRGLKAGDHIMTGSFTRQFLIAPGDRIRTEFERLGTVEATFV